MSDLTRLSKYLSYILRHRPDAIGLTLDDAGWADVGELLARSADQGETLDRATLEQIVRTCPKRRYVLSDDGTRIRASQGHSLKIDLALAPEAPPETLYHGTATRFLDAILREGLRPMSRTHVHLSADRETAVAVGRRHGTPIVLAVAPAHDGGGPPILSLGELRLAGGVRAGEVSDTNRKLEFAPRWHEAPLDRFRRRSIPCLP